MRVFQLDGGYRGFLSSHTCGSPMRFDAVVYTGYRAI